MNYNDVSKSVRKIAQSALESNGLAKHVIIQRGNKYIVFDKFSIVQERDAWIVNISTDTTDREFATSTSALAWCILMNIGKQQEAHQLAALDRRVATKQADIDITSQLISQNTENSVILQARLIEDINSRRQYRKQLSKCIETAKYIQIKGNKIR